MKTLNKVLLIALTMTSFHSLADSGASQNASAASKHSALAASHGALASAKIGSAVIATPLIIAGSVGNVSLQAGSTLMKNAVENKPLEITDKTITAAPSPQQMINKSKNKNKQRNL